MPSFRLLAVLTACVLSPIVIADSALENPLKTEVIASVDAQAEALADLSDEIWGYAEIAFRESQAEDALVRHAEAHGFAVTRGTGGIPTAFVA